MGVIKIGKDVQNKKKAINDLVKEMERTLKDNGLMKRLVSKVGEDGHINIYYEGTNDYTLLLSPHGFCYIHYELNDCSDFISEDDLHKWAEFLVERDINREAYLRTLGKEIYEQQSEGTKRGW